MLSRVARVPCKLPCRSQIASLVWPLDVTCHAAKTPPDGAAAGKLPPGTRIRIGVDRKSTRLNSSHLVISYAVFCLKKKKKHQYSRSNCTNHNLIVFVNSKWLRPNNVHNTI